MTRSRETQHEARDRRRAGWRLQAATPRRGRVLKRQRYGGGTHLEQKKTKTAFFGRKKKRKKPFYCTFAPCGLPAERDHVSAKRSSGPEVVGTLWGGGERGQRSGLRSEVEGRGSKVRGQRSPAQQLGAQQVQQDVTQPQGRPRPALPQLRLQHFPVPRAPHRGQQLLPACGGSGERHVTGGGGSHVVRGITWAAQSEAGGWVAIWRWGGGR